MGSHKICEGVSHITFNPTTERELQMAQATGYVCDRCKRFDSSTTSGRPVGWIRLLVNTNHGQPEEGFDLCSNKCLFELSRDRHRADKPVKEFSDPLMRTPGSLAKAEGARKANHVRHHVNRNIVDDDCRFCQEATEPTPMEA